MLIVAKGVLAKFLAARAAGASHDELMQLKAAAQAEMPSSTSRPRHLPTRTQNRSATVIPIHSARHVTRVAEDGSDWQMRGADTMPVDSTDDAFDPAAAKR